MSLDKLVDSAQLDADLEDIADAIRTKGGTSAQLAFPAGFVSAIGAIPTGGTGIQFELVGTETQTLEEYTGTGQQYEAFTNINVGSTDYAYLLCIITCDSAITTSTEWGMSIALLGRYSSSTVLYSPLAAVQEFGTSTLSKAALANQMQALGYGVNVLNAQDKIRLTRRCYATGRPDKCRAGNYTITVYGLKSL